MRSKYLSKTQLETFRKVMGSQWYIFELMRQTGMRVGDAVKLRGSDISRDGESCTVSWVAEKTGKAATASISASLCRHIQPRSKRAFCFPGRKRGTHLTRQAVWSRIKKAADTIGLESDGVSPHSFRKVFAVDLMHEEGLSAVQEALQHSNEAVTRVYAYADTILRADSDEPIRWRDLELIVDYILQRLSEKG